ncbi:hypothetical protein D3C72_997870 [compost metagenome]
MVGQPGRIRRTVRHEPQRQDAEQHAGQALDQEHPLPAGKAGGAYQRGHQPRRYRAPDNAAEGTCDKDDRNGAGHALRPVPARQVVDHARREARFEDAEQEAHGVERRHIAHEQHAGRGNAPQHQDAAEGLARANARQHQVARDLEQHVADEEDAGAHAVGRVREPQVALHLELGEADVHAVQVGEQVADQQKGQQSPVDLVVQRGRVVDCTFLGDC